MKQINRRTTSRATRATRLVGLLAISAFALAGCGGGGNSAADTKAMQKLVAAEMPNVSKTVLKAACKEGKVSVSLDAETNYEQFASEFHKAFPCIDASATVGEDDDNLARFLAGQKQGSPPDVIQIGSDLSMQQQLASKNLLMKYVPSNAKMFHTISPGYFYAPDHLSQGILYNTKKIDQKDMEPITTWKDLPKLLGPDFKGKRLGVVDPHGAGGGSYMVAYVMHKEVGDDAVDQVLKYLDVTVYAGSGPAVDALASGEIDLMIGNDFNGLAASAKGAPVQVQYPAPGSNTYPAMGIAKDAPHPNAAKLFEEFCLSKRGQALYPKLLSAAPGRTDIKDTRPAAQKSWYKPAAEPYDYDIADMKAQYDAVVAPYPTK